MLISESFPKYCYNEAFSKRLLLITQQMFTNFFKNNGIINLGVMIMLRSILVIITIPLVVTHFAILYFWVFDWRKLATQVGLISWIGSIILGILVYFAYRKFIKNQKFTVVSRKVLFSSTLMTIVLGVLALVIEAITSSMP
jgi:hypothetical protein